MIVPLKKVTVVCVDAAKDSSLVALRELGLLHVIPLQTPVGESVDKARRDLGSVQKALEALPESKPQVPDASVSVEAIHELLVTRKKCEETLGFLKGELARLAAFGHFDPVQISELASKGVQVKLYECDESKYRVPQGECSVVEYRRENGMLSYAVASRGPIEAMGLEVRLPDRSILDLEAERDKCLATLESITSQLNKFAEGRNNIEAALRDANDSFDMAVAGAGMMAGSGVSLIQGYCPEEAVQNLRDKAPSMGWGLRIEDPADDEEVPTLLRHPKAVKPIETLYGIIGITPGYREIDTSSVFLLFFSVFFAMIVGDAGYGLLFLGATIWGAKKFPQAPRETFQFLGIMSVVTILWGVINASYFGISSKILPAAIDLLRAGYTPEPLRRAVAWIRDENNLKFFCFVIGVVHLTIAHLWNAWVNRKSTTAIAQIGWLCTTWTMFFLAGTMVIGKPFPQQALYVGVGGAVLILLFSVPPSKLKDGWFDLVMLPLNLVSNFVDVISYIRLFAVGMAGFAVANSFNEMMAPMFGSIPGALIGAIILFLAHGLNIVLAAMGVAVHAVRLNTLEFSNHVGLQWSGYAFQPFSKQKN